MNNFYTHGFLHADDICTLASSISTLKWQFVEDESGEVRRDCVTLVVLIAYMCLLLRWKKSWLLSERWTLSSRAVQDNITKVRRNFFMFGSRCVFREIWVSSGRFEFSVCTARGLCGASLDVWLGKLDSEYAGSFLTDGKENSEASKVGIQQCSEVMTGWPSDYEGKNFD